MKTKIEKRKLLLLVPLPVILCSALFFYALGGGQASPVLTQAQPGLNASLPDAKLKSDTALNKMTVYQKRDKDSSKQADDRLSAIAGKLGFSITEDPQTKAINDKLAQLNQVVNAPTASQHSPVVAGSDHSADVARLEAMMKTMQQKNREPDPELAQLSGMMQQIMAIQNPGLVKQSLQEKKSQLTPDSAFKAVPAIIARDQKIVEGAVVELRLADSLVLGKDVVPKGYVIYGLAGFSNQRLNVQIKNIRLGTSIIPVKMTVFDRRDGMPGINAPEAELAGAVANGVSDASGSIGITGFDLTSQLAGAGIDAAKGLLRKKVKKVKQKLVAGYPLLLRNEQH